jgi:hypothetical protein
MNKQEIANMAEKLLFRVESLYETNYIEYSEKLVKDTLNFLDILNVDTEKWFCVDNKNNVCVLNFRDQNDSFEYLPFEDEELTEVVVNNAIWTALELNEIDFNDNNEWVY